MPSNPLYPQYRDRVHSKKGLYVSVEGLDKLYEKIEKISKWSLNDAKKLTDINKKVGNVYANALKANIKDTRFDGKSFQVTHTDKEGNKSHTKVYKGQLRRSSGVWKPQRNSNRILAGPRTRSIGRKGKTPLRADGWFAHIVEKGDFSKQFGGKHSTQNTGVFERTKKATQNRSKKLQEILLRREFSQYVSRL